ncbi:MAG: hypothetical protein AAGE01_15055 [Pseudomonadota bacterium]
MLNRPLALLTLCLALQPTEGRAAPYVEPRPVKLTVPATLSAQEAYERIETAGRRACRTPALYTFRRRALERVCLEAFINDAVILLARPALTQLHEARQEAAASEGVAAR